MPSADRSIRRLPRLATGALGLVWAAAPKPLAGTVSLQVVSGLLLAAQVIAARMVLSRVLGTATRHTLHAAVPWLVALAVIFAVTSLIAVFQSELQRLLAELVSRHSLERVVKVASAVDLVRFDDPTFHDRLQRTVVNSALRPYQMTLGLMTVAASGLSSLAVAATLATIEPLFLVLILVSVVPVTLVSLRIGRSFYRFAVEQTPNDRQRTYVQQVLTDKDSAKEVRAYALAAYLQHRYSNLWEVRLAALRKMIRRRLLTGAGGALVTGVAVGATLGLLVLFISDGRVSLAGAGAAAAALLLLGTQLQSISAGVGVLYESSLFIDEFNGFLEMAQPARSVSSAADYKLGTVEVRDLYFTYPTRTDPSLCGVNMTIEPGQVVALVGENGSGKTTLAKLLAGLYSPQAGSISWDGRDITEIPLESVRGQVTVLFQDFLRYFMPAYANVALGDWTRFDQADEVFIAAQRAGAHGFIQDLPSGYDTILGPQFLGGSDLSGGQWQRMALARAFFRDAQLVVLDEPTAALDPRAEAELFSVVRELFADRSVLLISHRFATVRRADHIYVLEAGQVVEHGTHTRLMREKGLYAELFTLQSSAFKR